MKTNHGNDFKYQEEKQEMGTWKDKAFDGLIHGLMILVVALMIVQLFQMFGQIAYREARAEARIGSPGALLKKSPNLVLEPEYAVTIEPLDDSAPIVVIPENQKVEHHVYQPVPRILRQKDAPAQSENGSSYPSGTELFLSPESRPNEESVNQEAK